MAKKISTQLPLDLQMEILSRLPMESVLRLQCVSKTWRSIMQEKDFQDRHYRKSGSPHQVLFASKKITLFESDDDVVFDSVAQEKEQTSSSRLCFRDWAVSEMYAPVRGLVCFKGRGDKVVVCNPLLRKTWIAPEIEGATSLTPFLGYNDNTKVYKVLCIADTNSKCHAYTMGIGDECWKSVVCNRDHYPYTNGVWKGDVLYYGAQTSDQIPIVVTFNIKSGVFVYLESPNDLIYQKLVIYEGNVALVSKAGLEAEKIKMFVIRDETSGQWYEECIQIPAVLKSICGPDSYYSFNGTIGSGELIFSQEGYHKTNDDGPVFTVVLYNSKTHKTRQVTVGELGGEYIYYWVYFDHVPSLAMS